MLRAAQLTILAMTLCSNLLVAAVKLYLKDGSFHMVREFQTEGDRVRYYSTERGEWEELPLALVDLKKTEEEKTSKESARRQESAAMDAEEKAERAQEHEISRIPVNPGVYYVQGDQIITVKQVEVKMVNNKRRSILKAVSPIPVFSGKSTVEVDGLKAELALPVDRPEFYFRMNDQERLAIVRTKPGKASRVVQTWDIVPVTKEIMEQADVVETFKQQIADGLYKLWPTKPLTPGEYAVIEYTEGKGNIQVWDFSVSAK